MVIGKGVFKKAFIGKDIEGNVCHYRGFDITQRTGSQVPGVGVFILKGLVVRTEIGFFYKTVLRLNMVQF